LSEKLLHYDETQA